MRAFQFMPVSVCLAAFFSFDSIHAQEHDLDRIVALIAENHERRVEALSSSTGRCEMTIVREELTPEQKAQLDADMEELGRNSGKLRVSGSGGSSLEWYQSGGKLRYDMRQYPLDDGREKLFPDRTFRLATDSEKAIYYYPELSEGYINNPPTHAINPYNLTTNFHLPGFYRFMDMHPHEHIERIRGLGVGFEIREELRGGIETLCIHNEHPYDPKSGRIGKTVTTFWVAPSMGYSLLAARFESIAENNDQSSVGNHEYYEAAYSELPGFPGVWTATRVEKISRRTPEFPREQFTAVFTDLRAGVEIDDRVFTFEGMGVPYGTLCFDRRLDGNSIRFKYTPDTKIGLNEDIEYISAVEMNDVLPGVEEFLAASIVLEPGKADPEGVESAQALSAGGEAFGNPSLVHVSEGA